MVSVALLAQLSGVTAKSRFGEPPVRATSDVSTPLFCAVNVTMMGEELAPTVVVPGNVSGVVETWAVPTTAHAITPIAASGRLAARSIVRNPLDAPV